MDYIFIIKMINSIMNTIMIDSFVWRSWSWSSSFIILHLTIFRLLLFVSSSSSLSDSFFSSSQHYDMHTECDQVFISSALNSSHGSRNGTFVGPSFIIPMLPTAVSPNSNTTDSTLTPPTSTTPNHHTRQCIYTFIAGPNEHVKVSFTKFLLRAESPECLDEYLDIYAELKSLDWDLLNTPFGGRYCDLVIPHDRISLFQTIVISFYTAKLLDGSIINGTDIFEGTYEFINATPYVAGTPWPNEVCSYTIFSEVRREGEFMSPTYPGVYPKNITCYYLFKGVKGQRVKLEFMDFDLYYGGSHCPYDYVKIYDGENTRSPLINTYCGQQRQLFVFSSGVNLLVQFTTLKRISSVNQNRGFSGYYEFSEKFVNLGFILNNENSEHIRGTECDQKIFSRKESNGTIYAPNYPFLYHSNIMCKYFLYGLQDAQNLERINFHFEMLQIPTKDVNECTDAYVRLYTQLQAMEEFDYVFCGETIPPPVISDGPLLLVVFNSGSTQGQGFKAHYWFETDYKITGTQASPGQCHFSYVSSGTKSGEFNSPRHPSNYPSNTYCIYEFYGEPDEQVKVVFNHFKFSDADVSSLALAGYNEKCTHDWIEIYTVDTNGREQYYGRYCGYTAPGPIITERGVNQIKVIMNTDGSEVSSGFSANYQFDRASDMIQDCGGNFTNLENGIIQTPNYPNSYSAIMQVCNWFITVKTGSRVLLYFDEFSVEGDPPNRGCSGAIVRVWPNLYQKPIELCGEKLNQSDRQYISEFNVLRITFLTAQKAVGALGFSAIWTEVDMPLDPSDVWKNITYGPCLTPTTSITYSPNNELQLLGGNTVRQVGDLSPYQCQKKGYCISSKLHCNGIQNCGFDDDSDESDCIHEVKINLIELVGGMTGLFMFVFFTIGLICLTIILVINWYRRSGEEKNVGHIIDKTCQHYFSHSTSDYSAYYESDPINVGTPHRLIDVMTVSSSSTTPGGQAIKNVRWPSASNSADSSHHPTLTSEPEQIFLDGKRTSNSPIPPPPPPPVNRSLLTLRQSSLVNFHYGATFKDPNSHASTSSYTTRSMIGIDRNCTNRPCQTTNRTTSRQSESRTSTFTAYPYCTLNNNTAKSSIHCPVVGSIGGCTAITNGNTTNRSARRNTPPNHHQSSDGAGTMEPILTMDSTDSSQLMPPVTDDDEDILNENSLSNANEQLQQQKQQLSSSQQSDNIQQTNNGNIISNDYLVAIDHEERLLRNPNKNDMTTGTTTNREESDSIILDAFSINEQQQQQHQTSATISSLRKYQMSRLKNVEPKQQQQQQSSTTTWHHSDACAVAAATASCLQDTQAHSSLIVDE